MPAEIRIDPFWLLAPAFVLGVYIGFRRGWQKEVITSLGLLLAIIFLGRGPEDALAVLNGILARLARALGLMVGVSVQEPPRLTFVPEVGPLVSLALFIMLVTLAYAIASRLGDRFRLDRGARFFGALVGGLNLFVVMSLVLGSLRLAGPAGLAANGATVRIPSFSGVSIVVPPAPSNALMMTWPLAAVVFLLVSMLVYVLVRIART